MSRNVTLGCVLLIAVLIGLLVFWPDGSRDDSEASDNGRSRRHRDGGMTLDDKNTSNARPATRIRPTGKANPKKIQTESGLVYQVLDEGTGHKPNPDDKVVVRYRGYLPDGTEFDRSPDGESVTFSLNAVIKGWSEGLQLMRVGSKYRFIIPPELAYGKQQVSKIIGPNQILVFDVELVGLETQPQR